MQIISLDVDHSLHECIVGLHCLVKPFSVIMELGFVPLVLSDVALHNSTTTLHLHLYIMEFDIYEIFFPTPIGGSCDYVYFLMYVICSNVT